MFKLDNDFLISLGLGGLPVDEKNKLLQVIYERLEMNVGMRLAERMNDEQLEEFEGFIDRNDEAGALRWLETNFPNYKDVVAGELEKLKVEVSASAPQILAAAQTAQQMQADNRAPVAGSVPPAPQGQQAPQPQAYNPENPFQTNNPEYGGAPAQPQQVPQPQQPAWQPAPAPMQQQAPTPQPYAPPAPSYQQPQQSPYQQPAPGFNQPQPPAPNPSFSQPPQQQPPAGPPQPPAGY